MNVHARELVLLPPLGEVLDFLRLIWAVDQQLHITSKRMEAELGVTAPQRFVLRLVGRFPGITASQLAQALHVSRSTVTGVLKRLGQRRLVARRVDPHDRRRTFLGLTDAGRRVDAASAGTVEGAVREVIEAASPLKVAHTRELLAALASTLAGSAQAAEVPPGASLHFVRRAEVQ